MKKTLKVAAALISYKGKILLSQRKRNDHFALLWEFPGGGIEKNEKPNQAIKREIQEELGLIVEPQNLIGKFTDENKYLKIIVYLFGCKIIKGKPQAKECANFGFFSYNQAKNLNLAPVDGKIMNYLAKNFKLKGSLYERAVV
ncbi:MAG: NUDIX domain-containing protein [Candidatus Omnitrophica bacterium]|nr:NUDIX domain-containing protein [Candidatus Omnitrophota bacterium]MCM8832197.1 NUDIX domain-containing protein [Candidatus Omnitrophota bacterium]